MLHYTLKVIQHQLKNWADDAIPADAYAGIYYPHGLSTDLSGNDVVMPASAIALRTIAFSDQVSYPWFAPAGLTRGVVTNASAVGYVNDESEFVRVRLSEGQRGRSLYEPYEPNCGSTRHRSSSIRSENTTIICISNGSYQRSTSSKTTCATILIFYHVVSYSNRMTKITRDNIRDAVERFLW